MKNLTTKGMGDGNDVGLYINDLLVCIGPMDKLLLRSREHALTGDEISLRAIDDAAASKEHRARTAPAWDQPLDRSTRRAIEKARKQQPSQAASVVDEQASVGG